jgi:hypothetical protein
MEKVIVMLLLGASVAQVRAQEGEWAEGLGERAAFQVGREDAEKLDATTLGKGGFTQSSRRGTMGRITRSPNGGMETFSVRDGNGKRVFGGTTSSKFQMMRSHRNPYPVTYPSPRKLAKLFLVAPVVLVGIVGVSYSAISIVELAQLSRSQMWSMLQSY